MSRAIRSRRGWRVIRRESAGPIAAASRAPPAAQCLTLRRAWAAVRGGHRFKSAASSHFPTLPIAASAPARFIHRSRQPAAGLLPGRAVRTATGPSGCTCESCKSLIQKDSKNFAHGSIRSCPEISSRCRVQRLSRFDGLVDFPCCTAKLPFGGFDPIECVSALRRDRMRSCRILHAASPDTGSNA